MNKPHSNSFCSRPFTSFYVSTSGRIQFCCANNSIEIPPDTNIIETDLYALWNSNYFQTIRRKLLENQIPAGCERQCFSVKLQSGYVDRSPRKNLLQHNQHRLSIGNTKLDAYNTFNASMSLSSITFIELWFSNKCNLQCRTCNPSCSDQLFAQWKHIPHVDQSLTNYSYDWTQYSQAWSNLLNFVGKIFEDNPCHKIEFVLSGGEPMINENVYKFFDTMIARGFAGNITLRFNTNLTVLPSKMINFWSNFYKIVLLISCDGIGSLNEYIRYPSKWDKIISNLTLVKQLAFNNVELHFNITVQNYNIFDVESIVNWCKQYSHHVNLSILTRPKFLSIRSLPNHVKLLVSHDLKASKNLDVNKVLLHMLNEDWSDEFYKFIDYTKHIDATRKQNISVIRPELQQYFN